MKHPYQHMPILLSLILMISLMGFSSFNKHTNSSSSQDQRIKVILDTDAAHGVDDQNAIAYLIYSQDIFDIRGMTSNATDGTTIKTNHKELEDVIKMCGAWGDFPVVKGANGRFKNIRKHLNESSYDGKAAVDLIIQQAHANKTGKLIIIPIGMLTNIALAMEKDPTIIPKIKVFWLGSPYPCWWKEPNQGSDMDAANYLFNSNVELWIAPVCEGGNEIMVSKKDINTIMPGKGVHVNPPIEARDKSFSNFGDYSVELFKMVNKPSRPLYDIAPIASLKNQNWSQQDSVVTPLINVNHDGWAIRAGCSRMITIFRHYNSKAVMDDFWETMKNPKLKPVN